MSFPNHPEIECAMKTGYPSWNQPKEIYCNECGRDITDEEQYFDHTHETLCKRCLLFFHSKDW